MLIQIFGIWLLASNMNWLEDDMGYHEIECIVHMNQNTYGAGPLIIKGHKCDEVASSINKQLEK